MSSNLPIPEPPRTPPPLDEDDPFDPGSLPATPTAHSRNNSSAPHDSPGNGSIRGLAPPSFHSPSHSQSLAPLDESDNFQQQTRQDAHKSPFGFKPQIYGGAAGSALPASNQLRSNIGQRRGHKYKHSSVSHQIFLEPEPKQPLRLPASLPIPTFKEGYKSMTTQQRVRIAWSLCHLLIAGYVQFQAQGSLAVTALSHLIFYDAVGALLSCAVDVLGNFEVWKRASIRQPFGLERSEVVVGFAMSILLLFMGFDLISHGAGHYFAELPGDHEPHRPHKHDGQITALKINIVVALAAASTLVSAVMLENHARIARSLRLLRIKFLPVVLRNPSHLLTLSCATALLLTPLLDEEKYTYFDRTLAFAVAGAMCMLGVQLVKSLGSMLLMSFPRTSNSGTSADGEVSGLLNEIEAATEVSRVTDAKFWQVHYGLCVATLKVSVRGSEEALVKLREKIYGLIKTRLGGAVSKGTEAPQWQISVQFEMEKD